jgi:pimeloyl-ACP methyl ester carboxylesterase
LSAKKNLFGKVASRLGGALDEAILRNTMRRFNSHRPPQKAIKAPEQHDRRALLAEAIAFYGSVPPETYFAAPEPARPFREARGKLPGGELVDLKWESRFQPHWDLVRADYLSYEPNRFAHARLLRHHATPRGFVVCLHGYGGGPFVFEERALPTRWLYKLGFDVAVFQLPFHGRRGGLDAPIWPSVNVARTNEGFAQAIHDLRAMTAWMRAERGSLPLVVLGMSLGGYTTALWATVEKLDFAAPMIPVASFPDLLWAHGEGRSERARAEREGITVDMLREAMACHTPILRTPMTPGDRMLILNAEGDRIAPPEHARRLTAHFGCQALEFHGGHVLQVGRSLAFRAIGRRLGALGLLSSDQEPSR